MNRIYPAGLELGTILRNLPDCWRSQHILISIKAAYALGYANSLWNRSHAVRIAFEAAMESSEAMGGGNRARRRITVLHSRQTAA